MDPVLRREPHRRDGREPARVDDLPPAPLGLARSRSCAASTARRRRRRATSPGSRGTSERRREKRRFLRKGQRDLPRARSERLVRRRASPSYFLGIFLFVFVLIFLFSLLSTCGGRLREAEGHPRRLVRLRRLARRGPALRRLRPRGPVRRRGRRCRSCTSRGTTSTAAGSSPRSSRPSPSTGRAPYDTVVTHGFVVAGDGRKMSKSLGNTVEPQELITTDGADVLRLWVASLDYTNDDPLSTRRSSRAPRRPTGRSATRRGSSSSNLFDFDPARDVVPDAAARAARALGPGRGARAPRPRPGGVRALRVPRRRAPAPRSRDDRPLGVLVRRPQGRLLRPRRGRSGAPLGADGGLRSWRRSPSLLYPLCPFTAEEILEACPGTRGIRRGCSC